MRVPIVDFLEQIPKCESSPLKNFWTLNTHDVPEQPGIYVLISNEWFTYPGGRSPVFYIGQSGTLRSRLVEHLRYARQVRDGERIATVYWPRYEYAGQFGKSYTFARTWQAMKPKALEEEALASFARRFRAFPVANGAGSWNRI
jgi:hypothetical protein